MSVLRVVTLLTDFGLSDPFVAAMKGVILGLAPRVCLVDITHEIEPHDVDAGGIVWSQAIPYFPPGTIHLAVVDPGVGSSREIIAVRGRDAVFLAPDNGILGHVLEENQVEEAVLVKDSRYFLKTVSSTFHGRDIFAPVAAHIANGLPLSKLGPNASGLRLLGPPKPASTAVDGQKASTRVVGAIQRIDRFGNGLTNIQLEEPTQVVEVRVGHHSFPGLSQTYESVASGEGLALIGSSGFLEIAVNRGRADKILGLRRSQSVTVLLRTD